MPLVIPKAGPVQYVRTEEILAELLGHVNFDGEPWAIGDRLIFENGTESRIELVPEEEFHEWPDPVPADFEEVKRAIRVEAKDWSELFSHFETTSKRSGCAASFILIVVGAAVAIAPFTVGCHDASPLPP